MPVTRHNTFPSEYIIHKRNKNERYTKEQANITDFSTWIIHKLWRSSKSDCLVLRDGPLAWPAGWSLKSCFLSFVTLVFFQTSANKRPEVLQVNSEMACIAYSGGTITQGQNCYLLYFVLGVLAGKGVLTGIFWKNREKCWKEEWTDSERGLQHRLSIFSYLFLYKKKTGIAQTAQWVNCGLGNPGFDSR